MLLVGIILWSEENIPFNQCFSGFAHTTYSFHTIDLSNDSLRG